MHRIGSVRNVISRRIVNNSCVLNRYSTQINRLVENKFVEISDEIKYAGSRPIVALESTIITHGMPYPTNLEMAMQVENEIKSLGVLPATIGYLNGKLKVGLSGEEISLLAKNTQNAIKISRRDLPFLLSDVPNKPLFGGTTVSATCIAAHAAGIAIFCTGGIGGVHRDYMDSMDLSADLQELSRTPVAVVSAGIKSILDIEKTLEYLETLGVCVVSHNRDGSDDFPAFFTSKSGFKAPFNCRTERELATVIDASLKSGLNSGLLIGVPIPEKHSADRHLIDDALAKALEKAKKMNIRGKKVTPFLLSEINKITSGKSLEANLALIKNNAHVSAKVALELHKIRTGSSSVQVKPANSAQVTVIGGINLDVIYKLTDEKTLDINGVTQPAKFSQTLGGVGRNMAEALIKLGIRNSIFITSLSNDLAGRFLLEKSKELGFDVRGFFQNTDPAYSTGSYCGVFGQSGDLKLALGDMIAHSLITPSLIEKHLSTLGKSQLCVIDADIPVETIEYVCAYCTREQIPVWFNPTDLRKCGKIVESQCLDKITYMSPNYKELVQIFKCVLAADKRPNNDSRRLNEILTVHERNLSRNDEKDVHLELLKPVLNYLLDFVPVILLTRGCDDLILAVDRELDINGKYQFPTKGNYSKFNNLQKGRFIYSFPTVSLNDDETVMNVTGAGDSLTAGTIAGILNNYTLGNAIYNGLMSAKMALLTEKNISDSLVSLDANKVQSIYKQYEQNIKILKIDK